MPPDAPNLPKSELSPRKCCITCGKPLVAFMGQFMHIEEPCAGLRDFVYVEATIEDEFLHEKFEKLYGKPEIDDYKRIGILEEENQLLRDLNSALNLNYQNLSNQPLIRFLLRLFK